jgi:hypothetical protein
MLEFHSIGDVLGYELHFVRPPKLHGRAMNYDSDY